MTLRRIMWRRIARVMALRAVSRCVRVFVARLAAESLRPSDFAPAFGRAVGRFAAVHFRTAEAVRLSKTVRAFCAIAQLGDDKAVEKMWYLIVVMRSVVDP